MNQHLSFTKVWEPISELRGKGIGKALLKHIAQIAIRENFYGVSWMVLEWNEPALKFYESLGADLGAARKGNRQSALEAYRADCDPREFLRCLLDGAGVE